MIGETILHYPPKADEPLAHKILEKPACLQARSQNNNLEGYLNKEQN